MSLEYALLVSLAEHEASGYDLTRRFDASLGFFWRATHQQIYRVLASMTEAGLLQVRTESQDGKPNRRVYSLTNAGRSEIVRRSRQPVGEETVRSAFAVKVRGMPYSDAEAVLDEIRAQRASHAARLAYYEENCQRNYPEPQHLETADAARYAVLRGGIRTERAMLEWCEEMLSIFTPHPASQDESMGAPHHDV